MTATKAELKARLKQAMATMNWSLKSEQAKLVNGLLDLARSESGIPIMPDDLDADPWLFNSPKGTLDLRTGVLHEHRREDLITKISPTPYDPDARCPTWLRFLDGVFQKKTGLITFVQRLLGLCCTGDVGEEIFPIFYGRGANGKSTLINAVLKTLGADYAAKVRSELLMPAKGERHPTEIADLFGRRLVVAEETPEGTRLNEALIKDLTSRGRQQARRVREDFWSFEKTHKLILLTNHRPRITGRDHGIWRRLRLVPFEVTFWDPEKHPDPGAEGLNPELRQDKRLDAKLAEEAPGILAWMVRGCHDWQRDGLTMPKEVQVATAEYRNAEDVFAQFIVERCIVGPDYQCKLTALYPAYKAWCDTLGEKPMGSKTFSQALQEREFQLRTSNGAWYVGLTLRDETDAE